MEPNHPHIHQAEEPRCKQLIVNGKPFLILGAQLHTSSMSSAAHMTSIWQELREDHINTVLGAVTWEQIEPVEGKFDFGEFDKIIQDARSHDLHLVVLWFGAFKSGRSTYAPKWVKKDEARFPRVKLRKAGGRIETADVLSIFGANQETLKADKKAFEALIQHIKEVDEKHSTVVMIQVESEVGILGDSRDGSNLATKRFHEPVPKTVTDRLYEEWDSLHDNLKANLINFKEKAQSMDNASWPDAFGDSPQTDEIFMAYHYAQYLEELATAGKKIYALPFYTNVWQSSGTGTDSVWQKSKSVSDKKPVGFSTGGSSTPGDYPSGGGVVNVLDIWQLFAPSLDFIAPDIYSTDYLITAVGYRHRHQPLFIPEQRRDEDGARIFCSALALNCLGVSPYGIDTAKFEYGVNPYKKHYELFSKVSEIILAAQRRPDHFVGFVFGPEGSSESPIKVNLIMGEWNVCVEPAHVFGKAEAGSGMLVQLEEGGGSRFLLIGWGFQVSFTSTRPNVHLNGILSFEEKEVVDATTGELRTRRLLNGDETRGGKHAVMPNENPDYGDSLIPMTIPASTAIAEVEVYALEEET